jgi:hypothetical protein
MRGSKIDYGIQRRGQRGFTCKMLSGILPYCMGYKRRFRANKVSSGKSAVAPCGARPGVDLARSLSSL